MKCNKCKDTGYIEIERDETSFTVESCECKETFWDKVINFFGLDKPRVH